ncbi:hypothetical protein CYMTET_16799 [Cymbomonas tetramitiformis]|uniref:UDP-N-acetylmuramate--L-alanine ligase n=1 Tax=Cymbomonas tetramitiformis TaxID=36881 RepID=A0AAE0GBH8_9CHLO|nr:hypothetical protein CYMTET_16799 [Cymbomonas tetramitiformis]
MLQGKATFSPNLLRAGKNINWRSTHRNVSVYKPPNRVSCKSSLSRVDNPRNLPYTELKDGSLLFRFGDPQQAAFDKLDAPESSTKQQPGSPADFEAVDSERPSVHFIGIGGAGLSALAHVALEQGWRVSGSDVSDSAVTQAVRDAGAVVNIGHSADNLGTGTLSAVVVSSAIREGNPEVEAATSKGVSIFKRGEWLAQVTRDTDLVAVAGTHGKTTTSAMLAVLLRETFFDDITAVIGAPVPQFPEGIGAVVGSSGRFVLEADEYDDAFGKLDPLLAIVTNVELDHVDMYMSDAEMRGAFANFVRRVRAGGALLVCGDDAGARSLVTHFGMDTEALALDRSVITYGLEQGNHWSAIMLTPNVEGGTDFVVVRAGQPVGRVTLRVPGVHNVLNTLAVIAAAATLRAAIQSAGPKGPLRLSGLNDQAVVAAAMRAVAEVHTFEGVNRRFQSATPVLGMVPLQLQ